MPRAKRCGASLVELMLVIGIIAILISLVLPAIQSVRESARRAQCADHLKNLSLAALQFEAVQGHFPPAAQERLGTLPEHVPPPFARHNGISLLLPYFEEGATYQAIDLGWDWNHPLNEPYTKQNLGGILLCPSAPGGRWSYHVTDYVAAIRIAIDGNPSLEPLVERGMIDDKGGAADFGPKWDGILQLDFVNLLDHAKDDRRTVRTSQVSDGLSRTWIWCESAGKPEIYDTSGFVELDASHNSRFRWASSRTWMTINNFCNGSQIINCDNVSKPFSFHDEGANFAYADGAVRFHAETIDPQVFVSLLTMAGDEVMTAP